MKTVMAVMVVMVVAGLSAWPVQAAREFDRVGTVSASTVPATSVPRGMKRLPGENRDPAKVSVEARKAEFVRRMFWVAMRMR